MSPVVPVDDMNAETPLVALRSPITSIDSVYVRSNFGVPALDAADWTLTVAGTVADPVVLALDDLRTRMPVTEIVMLECAGNFRRLMEPVPDGTAWGLGAASIVEVTGVRLREVLSAVSPDEATAEWVFTGADRGDTADGEVNYAFSLPHAEAMGPEPLLVWEMNGAPLRPEHGFPLRLVVPGDYGMRSVKWLTSITATDRTFTGHFRQKYRYFGDPVAAEAEPVGRMRVRSMILDPEADYEIGSTVAVSGLAWSGSGRIVGVEVRVDEEEWMAADLGPSAGPHAPTPWSAEISAEPGRRVLAARATDEAGNAQPLEPVWNSNGYANNVVHRVPVTIRS